MGEREEGERRVNGREGGGGERHRTYVVLKSFHTMFF